MAAESEKFSSFQNPCADLSSRLPFTNRSPFGVPAPAPHPFVAHFYPLINSVGAPSPYLPPDPLQTSSNAGSVFASVAARRPDLLYTELCKNLFKANGFPPSSLLKNKEKPNEFSSQNNTHIGKDTIDNNFDFNSLTKTPFQLRGDFSAQEKGTNPNYQQALTKAPTALQSFCEGFYRGLTPNDYLLRLQAEQHFAAACKDRRKRSTFFQQTSGQPCSSRHLEISANEDSRFTKTAKQLSGSSKFPFMSNTQHAENYPNSKTESFLAYNQTKSSPKSNDSTSPPLDFSLPNNLPPSPKFIKSHTDYGVIASPSKRLHLTESKPYYSAAESQYLFKVSMTTTAHMLNGMSAQMAQTEKVIVENESGSGQRKNGHIFPDANDNEVGETVANSPDVVHNNSKSNSPLLAEPRIKRKRRLGSLCETCPACGVTVRAAEMKQHFIQEMLKLEKIANEVLRNSRKNCHDRKSPGSSSGCSQSCVPGSSVTPTSCKKITDAQHVHQVVSKENRKNTFQKVRGNRIERLNSRVGQCMRNQSMLWNPNTIQNGVRSNLDMFSGKLNGPTWLDYNTSQEHSKTNSYGSRIEDIQCPVCNKCLHHLSNHEQISDHVMQCAGPAGTTNDFPNHTKNSDQEVDIERDDDGVFGEEYEWCGQSRVRATALVNRDVLASSPGFQIIRNTENEDSDQDLNVETDDTGEFGPAQFTDTDLAACPSDEDVTASHNEPSTSKDSYRSPFSFTALHAACQSPSIVVQALKMKIQQLEQEKHGSRCLICMEPHTDPLVSIQCWHVHCEKCWMRALGVKKLCPQCNMITPASQLRRIYL